MRARHDNRDWRDLPDDKRARWPVGVGPFDFYQIEDGVAFFSRKKNNNSNNTRLCKHEKNASALSSFSTFLKYIIFLENIGTTSSI